MHFDNAESARSYLTAGNATVTLQSEKTGASFTYKIRASKDGKVSFVSLLTGPNNRSDFSYLGFIPADGTFRGSRKSCAGPSAPSFRAFSYTWGNLSADRMPTNCLIMHEGSCGRCARPLTDAISIQTGIGPICRDKV